MDDPVELFRKQSLKPDGQIKHLWPIEEEVLGKYFHELKDYSRIAIELPTGSGKSIIGLLILESWRRAGKRVSILTSSLALANDMARRCDDLGIERAVITGKREVETEAIERVQNVRRYARKQAIGIMNYWAYMMGMDIAEPNVLVVDDADFFENFLVSYYSVVVSRIEDKDIWDQMMDALAQRSIYQAKVETFRFSDETEKAQLIYFNHSVELVKKLRTLILSRNDSISEELKYNFDRNGSSLHTYLMFATKDAIIFIPYITPGFMHDKLRNVEKIVFMSATIGTLDYIHKTIGANLELKVLTEKDVKSQIGTMGKRIIFPLDGIGHSSRIDDDVLLAIINIYENFGKALIICNSNRDANKVSKVLQDRGHTATIYKKEADSTNFAKAKSGALITAGRYIGIDLPDDACRVAIFTRMPFVLGPNDSLTRDLLDDQDHINEKVSHRLVQAFGRCNRSPNDYAVYFMLDSRLAIDNQADAEICGFFPSRMKAELDYGQDYAITGGLQRCLLQSKLLLENKIPNFELQIIQHLKGIVEPRLPKFEKPYLLEIQAWYNLTVRLNYHEAAQLFLDCIKFYEKLNYKSDQLKRQEAWLHYLIAKCYYLSYLNYKKEDLKTQVIDHLKHAISMGEMSWFSGLELVINELSEIGEKDDQFVFTTESDEFKERLLRACP